MVKSAFNNHASSTSHETTVDDSSELKEPTTLTEPAADAPLLAVDDLHVVFETRNGAVTVVNGISYRLERGETLAILGESGSGKTVAAQAVMGILPSPPGRIAGGQVRYKGTDLTKLPEPQMRKVRGSEIAMVFQDSLAALNPVFTVGFQIAEMFRRHEGVSWRVARQRAVELMDHVRIPHARSRLDDYPHQFSGGMRQRAFIAMALALNPDVLIADEPTTALDVTVQDQIMTLLADLQRERGMGMLLITHDLGVAAEVCDRVAVMYAGRIVEEAPVAELYDHPAHPYTRGLLHSIPRADRESGRLQAIAGQPPSPAAVPPGCEFHPRCGYRTPECETSTPPLVSIADQRRVSCHHYQEVLRDSDET